MTHPEDWVHVEELERFQNADEIIKALIKGVYSTGSVTDIERALEELAIIWDIKIPDTKPKIVVDGILIALESIEKLITENENEGGTDYDD